MRAHSCNFAPKFSPNGGLQLQLLHSSTKICRQKNFQQFSDSQNLVEGSPMPPITMPLPAANVLAVLTASQPLGLSGPTSR